MQLMLFSDLAADPARVQCLTVSRRRSELLPDQAPIKRRVRQQRFERPTLFGYSTAWAELTDWSMVKDLSASLAISAVIGGVLRASECCKFFGLSRSWTRSEAIARTILDARHGESIGVVADACGINKKWLLQIAREIGLRYRNRRPTEAEIDDAVRLVVKKGLSFRTAASEAHISRSALHRYVSAIREDQASEGEDEGLHVTKAVKEWRCEIHGKINVYPCVACAAAAARKAKR